MLGGIFSRPTKCPLGDASAFREALSPSTPAELAEAQRLQALLMEYENDTLDVHIVWQPAARTDWAPTTASALCKS